MDEEPHKENLKDVGRRYADVMQSEKLISKLKKSYKGI